MPTYDIDIPGMGSFTVESPEPLTEEQVYQYATQGTPAREAGTYESFYGGEGFTGATGRRVGQAIDLFTGLPGSIADIVTGGQHGRLDAVLRTLGGVAAPFNITTAPLEAGVEQGLESFGVPEQYARLAGDVGGIFGAFGVGALAKAGALGEGGQLLARSMGVGRPRTAEEALRRDPLLKYIAEREPTIGATHLELAAREPYTIEELAMQLDRPEMSRVALTRKGQNSELWAEYAKNNQIISDLPEDVSLKVGNITFQERPGKDWNFFNTLGTPLTRAMATHPLGGAVAAESQLTELGINSGIRSREGRTAVAMAEIPGDAEARRTMITRQLLDPEQITTASEDKVPQWMKNFLNFMRMRGEVDRKIAIPRLRDEIRPGIARAVKAAMPGATDVERVMEVNRRVTKQIPDHYGTDEVFMDIFPSYYKMVSKKTGHVIGEAHNGIGWKMEVNRLANEVGIDPNDIQIVASTFLDTDVLGRFKGKKKRLYQHLSNGLTPTQDEILGAAKGEFYTQKAFKLMDVFKGENSARGFKDALNEVLNIQDRSFERWLQITDLEAKVKPMLKELDERGYKVMVQHLRANMRYLWGHRMPGSQMFDNLINATPLVRDFISPMALERWAQAGKNGIVQYMLKLSPRFHAVNSTQLLQTLLPILSDSGDLHQGWKLYNSDVGTALLKRHNITEEGSKIEGWAKGLGPTERWNQHMAFLTMYNVARKLGFSDGQAADFAKLRGNVYSQMMGLTTDQPMLFRKMDPTGLALMFKRFPVKQVEILLDLIKDKNLPGVGKWLSVNLALGGFKAASMGGSGWLTYKLYKEMEKEYGKGVADVFHTGLPAIIGGDLSSSVQLWDPPFGQTFQDQVWNFAKGPIIGLAHSAFAAAVDQAAVDPSVTSRVVHAVADKNPIAKGLYQLFQDDMYDFRTTSGRLKWKADANDTILGLLNPDLAKTFLGVNPAGGTMGVMAGPQQMKPAEIDTFIEALMDVTQRRGNVLDYVASRYGAAQAAGIDLGKDMEDAIKNEVDTWNQLWPEFPITGTDIKERAKRRAESVVKGTAERVTRSAPRAVKESPVFQPGPFNQVVPPPPPPGALPWGGG